MIFNRFLTVSVLALSTSASFANCDRTPVLKSGFNIGAGVGYTRMQASQKTNFAPNEETKLFNEVDNEDLTVNKAISRMNYQLNAGYDYIHGKLFTNIELDYRFNPSKLNGLVNSDQEHYGLGNPYAMKLKHRHDFGVSLRAGGLITPQLAVYAIGNARLGKFKQEFIVGSGNGDQITNTFKTRNLFGYGGGLGMKYALPYNMAVSLDATYDIYRKMHITQNAAKNVSAENITTSAKSPRIFNALLKISKTF